MGCSCGSPAPPSPAPQSHTGEQPSETSVSPALLLFNLMLLFFCFCISHLFSQKKYKPYAQYLQLFVQDRMSVSALSEIFNVFKANNADLFHSVSSVCFSKPAEQQRNRAVLQGRCICSEKIAKKKTLNTFFCSSELNKHIFNHMLLQLALINTAALIYFLFIFFSCSFQK